MQRRKAFTLIELLVVIAIIAILAAILFPVFAQAKLAAKKTTDLSNMKQLGTAVIMYEADSDDMLPFGAYWQYIPAVGADRLVTWRVNTLPYIKNKDIFSPPAFPRGSEAADPKLDYINWYEDARQQIPMGIAGIHSWAHPAFAPNGRSATEIPRVANLIMLMTSRFQFADLGTWTVTKTWYAGAPQYPGKGTYVAYSGKSNYTYYDGHAKNFNPCETFGALNWNPGDLPADDFQWEWWSGPDPNILRDWKQGAQPGYQANDYGCQDIPEYANK